MPVTADPGRSGDFISSTLICMIYEGLTRSLSDGGVELAIAAKVDISEDGLTYRFHLRPSFWSDGAPVTASDFEKSWKRILDPAFGSPCAYMFYPIRNAEKAYKGLVSLEEISIRAVDDSLLEVVLERPTPYFLSLTASPSYLPVPNHALESLHQWTSSARHPVSNGPFCLREVQSKSHLLLQKNKLFWNPTSIRLEEIHISIISNETTALQMFTKGDLNWLGGVLSPFPPDSLQAIRKRFQVQTNPIAATTFCAFKTVHPHLQNRHLRQALSLAIDRAEIVNKVTQMGETTATCFIPPSLISNHNRILYPSSDPELARLHLQKATEELGIDPNEIRLSLSYRTSQLDVRLAQALQTQWKEVLGLSINLTGYEPQCYKEILYRRDFDLALGFWIAQFNDPINILERFEDPQNLKNYPGWDHPKFKEYVHSLWAQTDPLKRYRLFNEAEEILAFEMPLAPIYHWSCQTLCSPDIQNLQINPNGAVLFERCYR